MVQKRNGGKIMLKELTIDNNVTRWAPTLKAHLNGEKCYCPICKSDNLTILKTLKKALVLHLLLVMIAKLADIFRVLLVKI